MNEKQHYEITFIINANLPENDYPGIISSIKDLITKNSGDIVLEENLGRKKLTYLIKKINKGFFYSIRFNLDSSNIKKIEKDIKLNKNILRSLIVKKQSNLPGLDLTKNLEEKQNEDFEEKSKSKPVNKFNKPKEQKQEIKKEKEVEEVKIEEKQEEIKEIKEKEVEEVKIEEKIETSEKKADENQEKIEEKVEQNELDKKLDEILNNEEI